MLLNNNRQYYVIIMLYVMGYGYAMGMLWLMFWVQKIPKLLYNIIHKF